MRSREGCEPTWQPNKHTTIGEVSRLPECTERILSKDLSSLLSKLKTSRGVEALCWRLIDKNTCTERQTINYKKV